MELTFDRVYELERRESTNILHNILREHRTICTIYIYIIFFKRNLFLDPSCLVNSLFYCIRAAFFCNFNAVFLNKFCYAAGYRISHSQSVGGSGSIVQKLLHECQT